MRWWDQRLSRAGECLALSALLLPTLAGCDKILGIRETSLAEAPSSRASCAGQEGGAGPTGPGIGWWSRCSPTQDCFTAGMPTPEDRPGNVEPGNDLPTFYLAYETARLGSRNSDGQLDQFAWRRIGLDLDGICTSSPSCPQSGEPLLGCMPFGSEHPDDGEYCRDNQLGSLDYMLDVLPTASGQYMATDAQFNCSLCQGATNILIGISSYNGLPNDDSVRVDMYPSPGIAELKPIDCTAQSWDTTQCWGRDDEWTIQRSQVPTGKPGPELGPAVHYDPAAYVRDGILVASLPENTPIWFPGDRAVLPVVPVTLQKGILIGRLSREADQWQLSEGIWAGRWKKEDLIEGFKQVGLCEDDPNFSLLRNYAETKADVLSTGANVPGTPCDALSVGFGFTAREAKPGPLVDVPELRGCAGAAGAGGAGA
jgi:hypothetical protein